MVFHCRCNEEEKDCGYPECSSGIGNDWGRRLRNDHLLRMAYDFGNQNGLNELETLKRFVLILLDLKDEAYQEKVDRMMQSTQPMILFNAKKS